MSPKTKLAPKSSTSPAAPTALLGDIRALIDSARTRTAAAVNSELTLLYWRVGQRIHTEILEGKRAEYGEEVPPSLATQLVQDYGTGFSLKSLRRMVQFAATFPNERIVATVSRQLSWSHFVEIIPLKDPLQREFYAQMASTERWSVRTLRERIGSMLYERTALSQKPEELITQELEKLRDAQRISPALIMRDPYILDFLGLKDTWHEEDLEAAIIREIESFLLELGAGFTFVARQKRIQIDTFFFHTTRWQRHRAIMKGSVTLHGGKGRTSRTPRTRQIRHPCRGIFNRATSSTRSY